LTGEATAGKSALVQSFHSDGSHFPKAYSMTTEVEILTKAIAIPDSNDSVEFLLYDFAGNAAFRDAVEARLDNMGALVLVYDVTQKDSLEAAEAWLTTFAKLNPTFLGVLVGTKADLTARREVDEETAVAFAEKHDLQHFTVSAKDSEGIEDPFAHLAQQLSKVYKEKLALFEAMA
ncbi:uncharacterized protein MONBRDRAFT_14340, partial [Monosiga brevicollis MX1]